MNRFALKTLFSDRGKLLAAVIGVVFSLVLINIQGGLYFGLIDRASLLINVADADLWVGHRLVESVDFAKEIHVSQLSRIKGLRGVQQAEPYVVGKGLATLPDGAYEDVWENTPSRQRTDVNTGLQAVTEERRCRASNPNPRRQTTLKPH
jgi:hypothetical protein